MGQKSTKMRLVLLVLVVLATAAAGEPEHSATCEEWAGAGSGAWPCGGKCTHKKEGAEGLKIHNAALNACLTKASFASKVPIVAGVVKSKCMGGIREKVGKCYVDACERGDLTCFSLNK